MRLYGGKGCGSAVVEALLAMAAVPYDVEYVEGKDRAARDRLRTVNPMAQVPTLVLADGTVLTESAGIALWIADRFPEARLLPDDPRRRALAYRWMVYFATNVYVPIVIGDFPERWVDEDAARAGLAAHALQRLKDAWLAFEAGVEPGSFLTGERLSALDVYVAMIARWRPGRTWLDVHCPKAMAAVRRTEEDAVVAAVWRRNFG